MRRRVACGLAVLAAAVAAVVYGPHRRPDLWLTPDQRADRLAADGRYVEAAAVPADPARQGAAWYRAGDFTQAAAAFARAGTPEGAFDRGNALVMLGKYVDAIASYDRALALRPGWPEAAENRAVAVVRRDRLKAEGGEGTGGKLGADAVTFGKAKAGSEGDEVQVAGGDPLTDGELRSLWLRRVRTKPADFLRAKFAYQRQAEGGR
jgi:Ca-activated chloride channel family protein